MKNATLFYSTGHDVMKKLPAIEGQGTTLHVSYLTVAATNIHLAVELALKALSILTVGVLTGHDLLTLFQSLDERRQKDISREFSMKVSDKSAKIYAIRKSLDVDIDETLEGYSSDINDILEVHKNGFVGWRYSFEEPNPKNKAKILLFDFEALAALFQVLQIHVGQVEWSVQARAERLAAKNVVNQSPDQKRG